MSTEVSPLRYNVDAITKLKKFSCLKELLRFLGAAGFYRKFVSRYANLADPLHALLKKDTELKWLDEYQRAFMQLKDELVI